MFVLAVDDLAAAPASRTRGAAGWAHNLPALLTSLIGREREPSPLIDPANRHFACSTMCLLMGGGSGI